MRRGREWLGDIKEIAKDVDWAGLKGPVGWKAALLGLLGVQVLNWLTPVVAAFGLLNGFLLSIVGVGPGLAALFAVGGPLAALAGLYGLVRPQPLNEGEDEIARQRRYGQHGGAGAGSGAVVAGAELGKFRWQRRWRGNYPGAHAAESKRRPKPGEFGTPWNCETEGPPVSGGGSLRAAEVLKAVAKRPRWTAMARWRGARSYGAGSGGERVSK